MFKPLDPLLKSELKLGIISLLLGQKKADFKYLQKNTKATSGNLSIQLQSLSDAGYIIIEKSFKNNYPLTECRITKKGTDAFKSHFEALQSYINTIGENNEKNSNDISLSLGRPDFGLFAK